MDRLGRRLSDIAEFHDQLTFHSIAIHSVQQGPITPMHIGLLGTMAGVVPYVLCAAALLHLLATRPDGFSARERGRQLLVGSCAFIYSVWALYGTGEQAVFWGFLVMMVGIPFYTWRQWRNRLQSVTASD